MFGALERLKAFYNLFKQGQCVTNPEFWKGVQSKGQPALASIILSLVALTKGTKYEVHMDPVTASFIGGGLFALSNWMLTTVTSAKVGMRPSSADLPPIEDHSTMSSESNPVMPAQTTAEAVQLRPQTDGLMADDRDGILPQ